MRKFYNSGKFKKINEKILVIHFLFYSMINKMRLLELTLILLHVKILLVEDSLIHNFDSDSMKFCFDWAANKFK